MRAKENYNLVGEGNAIIVKVNSTRWRYRPGPNYHLWLQTAKHVKR